MSDGISGAGNRKGPWPGMDYALSQGVTLRDDSILVQPSPNHWYHDNMAQAFWPTLPVVLEHEHFGGSVHRKAWNHELLVQSVEDYHASFMSIHWWPDVLLNENKDAIEIINRRMDYRLQLREIRYPDDIKIGESFAVDWTWANAGVAPCYGGGFPALTLKDEQGGIVSVLVDDSFDVKSLPVGPPDQAEGKTLRSEFRVGLIAPATKPGTYDVYVSIGRRDGTPEIALPYPDDDGRRRCKIGRMTLSK